MRHNDILTNVSAHELGHCLNLYHTHQPGGDMVNDTPNDPGLESHNVNTNCQYTGGGGFNPLTNNIMSYSRINCLTGFTNGQGIRMRYAIQNESITQNITSSSCTTISEVNNVCYPQIKTVNITNSAGATASWISSSNVQIIFSNNTSAEIRGLNSSSTGNGWIRATLSNGIILQENFEVGVPNISDYDITNASRGGTYNLNNRVWNRMDISLNRALAYNLKWDVTATNSLISHSGTQPNFNINPNQNYGLIQIGIKTENQCGCSQWKWKTFSVDGASGVGIGGIIHPE